MVACCRRLLVAMLTSSAAPFVREGASSNWFAFYILRNCRRCRAHQYMSFVDGVEFGKYHRLVSATSCLTFPAEERSNSKLPCASFTCE